MIVIIKPFTIDTEDLIIHKSTQHFKIFHFFQMLSNGGSNKLNY